MHRREFLSAAALASLSREYWTLPQPATQADDEAVDFADLAAFKTELRSADPRVRCFDLRRLRTWATPDTEFFTFHQTETPGVDPSTWRLEVAGYVAQPFEVTLDDLQRHPGRRELAVTLECSGNAPGTAANGLVSNGVWSGVPLASILDRARPLAAAREVVFFGEDLERDRTLEYPTRHARSLFIQDALHPDALLAFAFDGKPLSPDRGFPLRLILPGWYGMASIKWLRRIEVIDRRFEGPHMSRNYHSVRTLSLPAEELIVETSISRMHLKSVVTRVTRRRGTRRYTIHGAVWGSSDVASVELRVDDGGWRPVALQESRSAYSWRLWTCDWADPAAGEHTLISRATDRSGRVQPPLIELRQTLKTSRENYAQWPRRIVV